MVDNNTLALLHFDSGVLTDAVGKYTWVTRGTPTLNTSNKKFGAASLDTHNGNIAASDRNAFSFPSGAAFTMEAWVYSTGFNRTNNQLFAKWAHGNSTNYFVNIENSEYLVFYNSGPSEVARSSKTVPLNKWVHIAVSRDTSNVARGFIDGKLVMSYSGNIFAGSLPFSIGGSGAGATAYAGYLFDEVRISNVCRYYGDFTPPEFVFEVKAGLCISKSPINLLDKTSITGITTEGIQPANTTRHVAFKVDDAWKKLTIGNGGAATLTNLATQNITAASLISEGNTVAELANVTSVPGFVGKLVYPAVALYAGESATVMPTFGMTIEGEIDTTINTYTYTDYSQEYVLSTEADVPIVSCVADTTTTGNGSVDITARIKQGDTWSEYMSLESLHMKEANAIQLKAVYNVQTTSGADSCTIDKVTITYNTAGAIVSDATTEIVTVTQEFTNDLTYVHAYAKHEALNDAEIKAFCSLRKTPQKRTMYQIGNGTGANRVYQLQDTGVNQDTLMIYVDGNIVQDFSYNTETSQVSLTAPNGSVVSASYEYGWESSDWIEMTKGTTQVNDSGLYTTEYTYVIPTHEQSLTVTAVKYALVRPEGTVTNETIGVGTGKRQLFQLPHIAKKETMQCSGQWNFDQETNILTVIAPEGSDIVVSYNWIAETPKIYGIAAGWAED
jgi:hypothetical protein